MGGVTDLMTMTEAAERMKCSRQWVHYLIKKRRLKASLVGGIYILRAKDVDACDVRLRSKPSTNGHTPSGQPKKKIKDSKRPTARLKKR